jgi:hypothetical protein
MRSIYARVSALGVWLYATISNGKERYILIWLNIKLEASLKDKPIASSIIPACSLTSELTRI